MNKKKARMDYASILQDITKILEKSPDVKKNSEEDICFIKQKVINIRERLEKYKKQFPDFDKLVRIRNRFAHEKDADLENTQKTFNDLFPTLKEIKTKLETLIAKTNSSSKKKRKFEKSGSSSLGSELERKQTVDALSDILENPSDDEDEKISFPKNNFSTSIEDISKNIAKDNFDFLHTHPELSENIQEEILTSTATLAENLFKENPFLQEEYFIEQLKKVSAKNISQSISSIKEKYFALPTNDEKIDFKFYQDNLEKLNKELQQQITEVKDSTKNEKTKNNDIERINHESEIYARNLISDLEKSIQERKDKWQVQKIDEWRKQFLEDLYKKIENFKKLEKLIKPFCQETGYLWNLANSPFKNVGFEVLEKYADLLEKEESLQELAKLLGKQNKESEEYEKELRKKTIVKTEFHPEPAFKGEICGITLGNDISSVLPSELVLFKNPATKKLFELKFAQQQLLSFDYISNVSHNIEYTELEEIQTKKGTEKGPVILCIDTSGSMNGSPEQIAKTIAFAITKIAREENRKCFLISFSTQIETLDLSGNHFSSLERLVNFLRMSFHGGTDVTPALRKSLEMLKTENYRNADVLMISDFIASNLDKSMIESIKLEKKNKTNFYSLVIGSSENKNLTECFTENWTYNLTARDSMKKLVRQIKKIRNPLDKDAVL